jgi:ABC-type multidrug transport system ATPase subunit
MKQKLALCCALIHKPEILILDEPTTGVDAVSRKEFWEMLKRLKSFGITILVSTPYMDEASLCDRIALMQQGNVLDVNTPEAMTRSFPEDLWIIRSEKIYVSAKVLEKLPSLISVNSFGQVLHLVTKKGMYTKESIQKYLSDNSEGDTSVEKAEATIEDVFILLMKDPDAKSN